jgi:hypothetical protein
MYLLWDRKLKFKCGIFGGLLKDLFTFMSVNIMRLFD